MRLLLDTHAFLWLVWDQHLSNVARELFLNPDSQLYFSAASYWEICIKRGLNKLTLTSDWIQRFEDEMAINGIFWLPIGKTHCQRLLELPLLHGDPFDRLLIAQAAVEGLTLLTADPKIQQYEIATIW